MRSLHLQPYSLLSETFDWIIEKLHSYECIINSASLHNTRINISQKFIIILSNIISTINQSINYNLPPAWLDNGTSPWRPKHGLFLTDHCYPLLNEFRWGRVSFSLERKKKSLGHKWKKILGIRENHVRNWYIIFFRNMCHGNKFLKIIIH